MYLILKLIFIYSLFYNVELLPEECIADYLLLSKNVKTDSLAKSLISKFSFQLWDVKHNIPKNEAINQIIFKNEIADFMGEKYAELCFKKNENFLNISESGLHFDMEKLFSQSEEKTHLILSEKIVKLLDEQIECLNKFLNKNFDKKYTTTKIAPNIIDPEYSIINFEIYNTIEYKSKKYITYWDLESSEILNTTYIKGTKEYSELAECNKLLYYTNSDSKSFIKKKYHQNFCYETTNGEERINLKQILDHFNLNQFYLKKIPFVKYINVDQNTQCSICLVEFKVGEKVMQLRCNHIFHLDCIQTWLNNHSTCPLCRQVLYEDNEN